MTTYYVSSIIGSDDNAGTSGSAPLASLQAAENLVKPGDTVEVMNGTYTGPGGGNVLTISTSGTASAPITFEAAPGPTLRRWTFIGPRCSAAAKRPPASHPSSVWSIRS